MKKPLVVELTADCAVCMLEGGVLERYDASHAASPFGVAAHARCRLCLDEWEAVLEPELAPAPELERAGLVAGRACPACDAPLARDAAAGEPCAACGARASRRPRVAGARPASRDELTARLAAWAEAEGFGDVEAFARATFVDGSVDAIWTRLEQRAPVEVMGDPFDVTRARGASATSSESGTPRPRDCVRAAASAPRESVAPAGHACPGAAPPRAIVYPLVSVIAADGEVHPRERALVDAFLAAQGLAPLEDHEIVVHSPEAVARFVPEAERARMVELMCEAAMVDGVPDRSERRIVHAYAAAWGIDAERVDAWAAEYHRRHTTRFRALWLLLRHYVLVAPWRRGPADDDPRYDADDGSGLSGPNSEPMPMPRGATRR